MYLVAQLPKRVIDALHELIDTTGRPEVPVLVHERVDFLLERLLVGRWLLCDSQWGRRCGNQHQSGEHLKTWSHVTLPSPGPPFSQPRYAGTRNLVRAASPERAGGADSSPSGGEPTSRRSRGSW